MVFRHLLKIMFRSILLVVAVYFYFANPQMLLEGWFFWLIWVVLAGGMMLRIIPNKFISMGARKHNKSYYDPDDTTKPTPKPHKGVFLSCLSWFVVTITVILTLHQINLLTPKTLLLWTLVLSVLDIVFILFYCPFQRWFMKNRCCTTCRIYNWDYFMMVAPLVIFPSFFSVSLVALAVIVIVRWETTLLRHSVRFAPQTNKNLRCNQCADKLCKLNIIKQKPR